MKKVLEAAPPDSQRPTVEKPKTFTSRPPRAELIARGEAMRKQCPRSAHGVWTAPHDRPDPIQLIEEANAGRIPELIPLRHGRMLPSSFTFYRGTALNMAVDLAGTPTTGFRVQACGDAHLGNFRCFATPERRVIFDIHDLDETLPAPWEWDVKRLAASFVVACRHNRFSDDVARDAVRTCVRSYRHTMAKFSKMRALDVWYARFEAETLIDEIEDPLFLQVKEARRSVLEPYAGPSIYPNHGQRVVKGHRLMQSASDIFLGWTQDDSGRHFYVRQLRDMKLKFRVEQFRAAKMVIFAEWCGGTLARAHARSGEPALISGYLGKADTFDRAIADFAVSYADQVERDYERFVEAVRDGKLQARSDDLA